MVKVLDCQALAPNYCGLEQNKKDHLGYEGAPWVFLQQYQLDVPKFTEMCRWNSKQHSDQFSRQFMNENVYISVQTRSWVWPLRNYKVTMTN